MEIKDFFDKKLTPDELSIYLYLYAFENKHISYKKISEKTLMSRRTVITIIDKLIYKKLIIKQKIFGEFNECLGNVYKINN
jgi:DNA-binding MarR family transcriptional regulator